MIRPKSSELIKHVILLDIVGLEIKHLESGNLLPNISKIASTGEYCKMEPVFPALTSTVQASVLSGKYPNEHGIICNGLYDRNKAKCHSGSKLQPSSGRENMGLDEEKNTGF